MTEAEKVLSLLEELNRVIKDSISPEGECQFEPSVAGIALKFALSEIRTSAANYRKPIH